MKPSGILYLVWWEGATRNPLIERQVIRLLNKIKDLAPERDVHLLLTGAFAKAKCRDRLRPKNPTAVDLASFRAGLKGVHLHTRETIIAPRSKYFYAQGPVQRMLALGHRRWLRRFAAEHGIGVVHCRSYPAMWGATQAFPNGMEEDVADGVGDRNVRLLFDTRGVYPEEGVVTGCFSEDSAAFARWKERERIMCARADAIVNVSTTFTEHIQGIAPGTRNETIFTSTDLEAFRCPDDPDAGQDVHRLVYLGGISADGWHTPESLAWLYGQFREAFADRMPRLRIITRSPHEALRADFEARGIPSVELEFLRTNSLAETVAALRDCRYGALPLRSVHSESEAVLAKTLLGSKSGEYLAAGLPILCNHLAGGVARLVGDQNLGLVYTPGEPLSAALRELEIRHAAVRRDCRNAATAFDINEHARRYLALYDEL